MKMSLIFQKDICYKICTFLNVDDLFSSELIGKEWRAAVEECWTSRSIVNYLSYKKRNDFISQKHFILTAYKASKSSTVDIMLFGGAFESGPLETSLLHIHDGEESSKVRIMHECRSPLESCGAMASAVDIDGNCYVIGGWNEGEESVNSKVFIFNARHKQDGWREINSATFPRCFASACSSINGDIYLVGGGNSPFTGADVFADGFLKRAADTEWNLLPISPMRQRRCGHSSALFFDDTIFCGGGYEGGTTYLSTVERYHPQRDIWTDLPPMEVSRSGFGCAVGECGSVYVAGGSWDGNHGYTSFERLDLRTRKWEKLPDMRCSRGYASACIGPHGRFYITGGLHEFLLEGSLEWFDPRAGKWEMLMERDSEDPEGEVMAAHWRVVGRASHFMQYIWDTDMWTR